MLRILQIVAISLLLSSTSYASTVKMTYHFQDPVIQKVGEFDLVYFDGCRLFGREGKAMIPFYPVKLLLPQGEVAQSIEIQYQDECVLPGNYFLFPQQRLRPVSFGNSGEFIVDAGFYDRDIEYPESRQAEVNTHFMNGYGIALSSFTPVKYIPSTRQVSYYRSITVTIQTSPDPDQNSRAGFLNNSHMATDNLFKTVQNPGAISGYRFSNRAGRTGEDYEYLVITRNTYRTEFDTLISFYRERGITARVSTLEHIDSVSAGSDMQQKIRNYIIDEYLDHGIAFVLLGGDVEIVPYRGFYCTVLSGGSYMTDNSIPSDLYYSALDGSWDDDLDGTWGEPDEDDLFPEVAVGRLTFSDSVELHNMLHKSFAYQSSPVPGELTHPLLAGEHLWSSPITWGSDYLNLLIGLRSDNGYTTLGIQPTQAIDSMYDEYGNWSKADLMARINSGRPWLHHVGHANYTYAMKMSNSDITNANFSGSNGIDHNYCIVYTHGCNCGGFDNSDCIAEKMVGIDNFAVSFIGNSRYGWFVEGTTDGPSQHLHREFLDALFGDSLYQAGAALMRSKTETAPFVDLPQEYEPGATRWCFYDNYLLGDPMMAIWTQEPLELLVDYDPLIPAGADSLVVHLSYPGLTCSGYRCSLLRNDTIYGMAFTDATGKAVIPIEDFLDCSEARLIITGYNILPEILPVTISDYWLGFTTDWNEASNWYSGAVPDANSSVIIPPSPIGTKFPLTNSGPPRQCKAILINEGGTFHIWQGETFNILGNE